MKASPIDIAKVRLENLEVGDQLNADLHRLVSADDEEVPPYTSSIDAAKSLIDRVAPKMDVLLSWDPNSYYAQVHKGERYYAKTPAAALCLAALGLMQAKQKPN